MLVEIYRYRFPEQKCAPVAGSAAARFVRPAGDLLRMLPTGEQGAEQDEQRTGDRDDANGLAPQRDSERDGHDGDEVDRDRCAWGAYPTDQGGEGCPALAGVRNLGLDDPSPDRPVLHCNFGGARGVVFGDIGTSPITIQTAFNPNDPLPVPISTDNVYGVVSLIFWSVMIIVTLTYVTLVMRADNDGGGSIMALITLLRRYGGARGRRTAMTLAALGLFGAALFFGESMITPAISPGSDRNSLNRAVRAVLAAGRRRVRGARGRPGALPLRLGGRP